MAATLEEAKKLLEELDLTLVKKRVVKEKRWTPRMAEVAAGFYKNFLYLYKKYPEHKFSPTEQIDEIWHAHILHTSQYHEMCEKVFGYYIHHDPTNDVSILAPGFTSFQELHQKEFGYPIYHANYSLADIFSFLTRSPKQY